MQKYRAKKEKVEFRKVKGISNDEFIQDVKNSSALQNQNGTVEELVTQYDSELSAIIETHAPIQSKEVVIRPNTDFYTDDLRAAKRERRNAERKMRKTKLTLHKELYHEQCKIANKL